MKYLECIFTNCIKSTMNVEYLQAHILKKHNRFIHLGQLDELKETGDIKTTIIKPTPDKPRNKYTLKTHCIRGHKFTVKNTYITKQGRLCKTCSIYRAKKYDVRRYDIGKIIENRYVGSE